MHREMRKNKKSFPSPTPILLGWTYNWNIIFHCLGSSVASSHNWALYQAVTQMTQAIALCPCDWTPAVFTSSLSLDDSPHGLCLLFTFLLSILGFCTTLLV